MAHQTIFQMSIRLSVLRKAGLFAAILPLLAVILCLSHTLSSAHSDSTPVQVRQLADQARSVELALPRYIAEPRTVSGSNPPLLLDRFFARSDLTASMAWGDFDGDGDLDLAVGNRPGRNQLYRNDGGILTAQPAWEADRSDATQSVAWGDVDGDGDLDLAVGNAGQPNYIYRNDTVGMTPTLALIWTAPITDPTYSVAWGDVDGDGDLDLAVGNSCDGSQPSCRSARLYRTQAVVGGAPQLTLGWSSAITDDRTCSIAWGDMDGDGDLDLAAGNGDPQNSLNQQNRVYHNIAGTLEENPSWASTESDSTTSVAWGDYDGDGYLDLAVANAIVGMTGQPARLYHNNAGILGTNAVWTSTETGYITQVAWGDYDGDGDLDLAAAFSQDADVRLYRNNSGVFSTTATWSSSEASYVKAIAWGDYDGDGALDLAVGIGGWFNRLYRNNTGGLIASAVWSSTVHNYPSSVAWGDYDGDGDLDLAFGVEHSGDPNGKSVELFRNEHGTLSANPVYSSTETYNALDVAWGDVNGDGDLDLTVGNGDRSNTLGQPNQFYRNISRSLSPSASWTSNEQDITHGIAWGDYDGDGDLDLAVANEILVGNRPSVQLYRNTGASLTTSAVYSSTETDRAFDLAWGDYDGDGDLDLAVANYFGPNRLYRNDGVIGGAPRMTLVWSSEEEDATESIAWGDYDGDGDLDLAVGNYAQPNKLYRNDGGLLTSGAIWSSVEADNTKSIAWGDYDGDGDLDLTAGNHEQPVRIYRNDRGNLTTSAVWSSAEADFTSDIAWGDVDGDGDLDLAIASSWAKRLYRNHRDAQGLPGSIPSLRIQRPVVDANGYAMSGLLSKNIVFTYTLGDQEGDPVKWVRVFYAMDGGGRGIGGDQWKPALPLTGTHIVTVTPPVGMLDDFDPTLRNGQWSRISGGAATTGQCGSLSGRGFSFNSAAGITRSATARSLNVTAGGYIYFALKFGTGTLASGCENADAGEDVRLEYSTDSGFNWTAIATYDTEVYTHFTLISVTIPVAAQTPATQFRWRQLTNSGDNYDNWALDNVNIVPTRLVADGFDPAADASQWSFSGHVITTGLCGGLTGNGLNFNSATSITRSATTNSLDVFSGGNVHFTLRMGDDSPGCEAPESSDYVALEYSVDSGLNWTIVQTYPQSSYLTFTTVSLAIPPAASTSATRFRWRQALHSGAGNDNWALDNVHVMAFPTTLYTFTWDVNRSGFLGESDNVVLRMEAVPAVYNATNSTPGPYLYGAYASQTFPFRVRGTQVRVMNGGAPAPDAIVYRLPYTQTLGAEPIADAAGRPFRTDSHGYLQGRGEINVGDALLALAPITSASSYTMYYTNGSPNVVGADAYDVTGAGVQTLTVSAAHPLYLFNLDVALEWDAHNDTSYLEQLRFNLQRVSEYLYDFTNGQAALGQLNVFQNADDWAYVHVIVRANNRLRPVAAQGGIVVTETVDPQHSNIIYAPGQVSIGATWNRYGRPGQTLGEDWPIILAHELSHYLFYEDDTYLGLKDGKLIAVSTCKGSAMGDLYNDPNATEFIYDESYWQANCHDTLAEQTLGRNEWETLHLWYDTLITPTAILSGPTLMPFDFTTINVVPPMTPTNALADPTFYLNYVGGGASSSEARAYLSRGGQYVIDLGSPFGGQNRVLAHGAQPGDRLCVFDRPMSQYGCEFIEAGDDQIQMERDAAWNPVIQLTPVNSTTLNVRVELTQTSLTVQGRLYPEFGSGTTTTTLSASGNAYVGAFNLADPTMFGHVQVWVNETATEENPRREAIIAFSMGGNPGQMRGGGGQMRGGGGQMRGGGGQMRGGGGQMRGGGAPIVSPDGQMIFFIDNPIVFQEGQFYTIQGMAGLPTVPPGRTVIGQGYRLVATPGTPIITGSVSIQYLTNDVLVAGADESGLTVYYYTGTVWSALATVRDPYFNLVTAPSQGPGVYALMSSIQVPLYQQGWNLFAYPLQVTQTVTKALESIQTSYTTVYGYYAEDRTDPWKVYQVGGLPYVNDLNVLEPGRGYWISATQAITVHFSKAALDAGSSPIPSPPDTYYGIVLGSASFAPVAGMTVETRIGNAVCGRGVTKQYSGQIVYVVDVDADDMTGRSAGCGQPGRRVTFYVGGRWMSPAAMWDNSQLDQVNLSPGAIYLPLVVRQ